MQSNNSAQQYQRLREVGQRHVPSIDTSLIFVKRIVREFAKTLVLCLAGRSVALEPQWSVSHRRAASGISRAKLGDGLPDVGTRYAESELSATRPAGASDGVLGAPQLFHFLFDTSNTGGCIHLSYFSMPLVRLPADVYELLRERAAAADLTMVQVVRRLLGGSHGGSAAAGGAGDTESDESGAVVPRPRLRGRSVGDVKEPAAAEKRAVSTVRGAAEGRDPEARCRCGVKWKDHQGGASGGRAVRTNCGGFEAVGEMF